MANRDHAYETRLDWEGETGEGTARYDGYSRRYRLRIAGKPDLAGSADPAFRGEAGLHNPEDLLVGSIAACHMLTYLALCARNGVSVQSYGDSSTGILRLDGEGGGRFEEVTLRPAVAILDESQSDLALKLHERAHELCFVARSCNFPIRCEPRIEPASDGSA